MSRLSRRMAWALRHQPVGKGGWISINQLIDRMGRGTRQEIVKIVQEQQGPKIRYELDGDRIRARYGHSVDVKYDYNPVEPPACLLHGTSGVNYGRILGSGAILPMNRRYVHLTESPHIAYEVAERHRGTSLIMQIYSGIMYYKGFKFFDTGAGLWLVDKVPVEFTTLSLEILELSDV